MEDKIKASPMAGEDLVGLEFELGDNAGEQLVFDTDDLGSAAEAAVGDAPAKKDQRSEEFVLPGGVESDLQFDVNGFIDDPMQISPTYIPRFTEVSENYRARGASQMPVAREENKRIAPTVDPTSEIDEEKPAPHILVSSGTTKAPETDESMLVLKFNEEAPAPSESEEEKQIKALKSVIMESARPSEEEQSSEQGEALPEDDTPVESHSELESSDLPDPFLELVPVGPGDGEESSAGANDLSDKDIRETVDRSDFGEFTRLSQRDAVKDRFLDNIISVRIRLIGALVLFALLVVVDVLSLFSVDALSLIGLGDVAYASAVIDLQLSVCLVLFAVPEIVRALKNISKKVFSPELVIPISLLTVMIHSITVMATNAAEYPSFGILIAIQVVVAILATHHRVSADFAAFKLVSAKTVKSVIDKRLTRTLPRENLALDGAVDEYNSRIGRLFRTAFVSNFFSRTSISVENSFNNVLMTLSSFGVAVVTALITWLVGGGGFADFTGAMAFVFLLSFPAFSMLVHKLPHHRSAQEIAPEKSAFIGESSLYGCADIDVIAYDDTEVFGIEDVSIKKVHLYGRAYNAGKAMHRMYSIFSAVGGPLCDMFASSVEGGGEMISDVQIEEDGISGSLDGHSVAAGTLEYMARKGISLPDDDYKTNTALGDSTKIMYGAEDGEVYVKFFIRYSFSEEFTMLLPSLKSAGIVPLVYTRDPNLTVEFFRMLTLGEDIIRVIKLTSMPSDDDVVYRRLDAGAVTLGDKLSAVNMILHAKKYAAYQNALSVSELIAMLAGTIVSVMFAITGSLAMPMVAIGALQLIWCAYLYVRTHYIFKDKSIKDDEDVV